MIAYLSSVILGIIHPYTASQKASSPPAPMNHVKIFKGWPPRDAPSKLVQLWYKSFQQDQRGRNEKTKQIE